MDVAIQNCFNFKNKSYRCSGVSLLAYAKDVDDLLRGVIEDGLKGLLDTESALDFVGLGCMPKMALILRVILMRGRLSSSLIRILAVRAFWLFFMASVLATVLSASPRASDERAKERVNLRSWGSSVLW